ncbi:MAG: C10 family peptidase, partial [Bacteroidota bacterium]
MLRRFIAILIAILLHQGLSAKLVSEQDAKSVAINFILQRSERFQVDAFHERKISSTITLKVEQHPIYYVFTFDQGGYIIVSADDLVIPVLAYSFDGIYTEENQAPQFSAWMEQYQRQILYAIRSNAVPDDKVEAEWNRLRNGESKQPSAAEKAAVEPLITSKWNQDNPYNGMCPADPTGPGGHAYAGCVPTCMGQIMYYYRWPETGKGSYTYTDATYGVQHVSYDSTTYEWENMKNAVTKENHGIAQLLYHLGVSCDLVYGPGGSGMYNHKTAYSLRTYFKYSPETRYIFRDSTSLNWDSLIIAHLNRKMPLYYAGWSVPNINGHAFVCDGYQGTDYFHFNFGWSGSFDGYFYINTLTPGGNNFNLAQDLVINIYPDTLHYSSPKPCNGLTTLHNTEGSIADGSG